MATAHAIANPANAVARLNDQGKSLVKSAIRGHFTSDAEAGVEAAIDVIPDEGKI